MHARTSASTASAGAAAWHGMAAGYAKLSVFTGLNRGTGMASDQQQLLALLTEIRDGQREIIELLSHQQRLAAEQIQHSRATVAESVNLQRIALRRQRTITLIAVPGILACIAAIAYLALRYF
jgi:hypothetical protein